MINYQMGAVIELLMSLIINDINDFNREVLAIDVDISLPSLRQKAFGNIGGVGPAVTVGFMDKIISHTKADKDQEHIKMVIEHNLQINDQNITMLEPIDILAKK